jgi:glycerol-3-phosphate acyltransferase PlsY
MPDAALLARLVACFLIGAIPFAVVAMWGTGVDIRRYGSGNPGFNNVLRYSKWRSIVCLTGDLGKGLFAVWLFSRPGDGALLGWLYGLAAIFGHCYSPLLKFEGGKGVATSAGVMLWLYPVWLAASAPVYVGLRLIGSKWKWVEAGTKASLASCAVFVALLALFEDRAAAAGGALLLAFVAWRHKRNFRIIWERRTIAPPRSL